MRIEFEQYAIPHKFIDYQILVWFELLKKYPSYIYFMDRDEQDFVTARKKKINKDFTILKEGPEVAGWESGNITAFLFLIGKFEKELKGIMQQEKRQFEAYYLENIKKGMDAIIKKYSYETRIPENTLRGRIKQTPRLKEANKAESLLKEANKADSQTQIKK